jgi:hypothetical protein
MSGLLLIALLAGLLAVGFGWRLVVLLRRGRVVASIAWGSQGLLWFAGFALALLVASNLYTYQRLTHEQAVAEISIERLAEQRYRLTLLLDAVDPTPQVYLLDGDQWQLDVRLLKWKSWANLLGLDSYFQLDRLSSRYHDLEQARSIAPSVHDLRPAALGLDVFGLKRRWGGWLPMVDAYFGQGVYLPLTDGARFRVTLGQQGLLVRPLNDAAREPRPW